MDWSEFLEAGCPCKVCGTPTNPKWDGGLATYTCLAKRTVDCCDNFFCQEHRPPEKHDCSKLELSKTPIYRVYRNGKQGKIAVDNVRCRTPEEAILIHFNSKLNSKYTTLSGYEWTAGTGFIWKGVTDEISRTRNEYLSSLSAELQQ